MPRISQTELYDDGSVIRQICLIKKKYQKKLTAGEGITIDENDVISASVGDLQHVFVGYGEPSDSLGNNGDIYIRRNA